MGIKRIPVSLWIGQILSFDMAVVNQLGKTKVLADYLSRHPSEYN